MSPLPLSSHSETFMAAPMLPAELRALAMPLATPPLTCDVQASTYNYDDGWLVRSLYENR